MHCVPHSLVFAFEISFAIANEISNVRTRVANRQAPTTATPVPQQQ